MADIRRFEARRNHADGVASRGCHTHAAEDNAMATESRQAHWENVYASKREDEVSWFQESPAPSLALIAGIGAATSSAIIDVGGGASRLVDRLIAQGFRDVTVLDVSAAALEAAKARLGERAGDVQWLVADATTWQP